MALPEMAAGVGAPDGSASIFVRARGDPPC